MSVQNPYSDVNLPTKSYFTNEAFETDQSSHSTDDADLKKFGHSGALDSAQHNGAAARSQVPNPYGSIYGSPPGGSSKQLGIPEEAESRCCPCCKCCSYCSRCVIS